MYRIVVFCLLHVALGDESRLVQLPQGPVRGYKDLNKDIIVFYNIPYATAPTGHQRFKAPLPPPQWTQPFEAVNKNIICPQADYITPFYNNLKIQEDCLIANVYVPITDEKKLPVAVYIHGGGYGMGWGDVITPKKLVSRKEVIVVTFNFRLGAHGFLCLGTEDVPGNAGMKDQVALLRWVKKNIANFGGDPDEVTIAGYSAGSASVELLMISKMAQGLFKRGILDSGSSTTVFSGQPDPIKNAQDYAALLTHNSTLDIYALEKLFKTLPLEELNSAKILDSKNSEIIMSPCVENDVGQEIFLDDSPLNKIKNGNFEKLPMLYGITNLEGLVRFLEFVAWKNDMNEKFSNFLPADLQFSNELEKEQIAKEVKSFYFGDKMISENTMLEYVNYFTDVLFAYPALRSVKLHTELGNDQIYLYEYSYFDNNAPAVPNTNVRGATHTAQSFAVLDGLWNGTNMAEEELLSSEYKNHKSIMREIWSTFITTGKPIPKGSELPSWPPVGSDGSPHMSIGRSLELRGSLLRDREQFWEKIYDKYYRFPKAPLSSPASHHDL